MRSRGYTLLELMVALTVSVLTIAAGVTLLIGSQRSFQSTANDRLIQETARVALDEIGTNVRMAGYGLEPTFAFDMGVASRTQMVGVDDPTTFNAPTGFQNQVWFGGYTLENTPVARDSTGAPDEFVFYSRDPVFSRAVAGVGPGGASLTLAPPLSGAATDLLEGQVLQVMCFGAQDQWLWAYVTVASVDAKNPAAPVVTLKPGQGVSFPFQNQLLTENCYGGGTSTVRAFKIDRYHYYVAAVDQAGNVQNWETPGTRPYLMLDQGLKRAGTPVLTPIVPDVEDLQVAYLFPLATGDKMLGAKLGTQVVATIDGEDAGLNLAPNVKGIPIPSFATPAMQVDVSHTTHHPANIRGVRVGIVVRSPTQDPSDRTEEDAKVPELLNRGRIDGEPGYQRRAFESTTYTRNLEITLPTFPTYGPGAGTALCCLPGPDGSCIPADGGNCGGG